MVELFLAKYYLDIPTARNELLHLQSLDVFSDREHYGTRDYNARTLVPLVRELD